jgi:hypothetical protein
MIQHPCRHYVPFQPEDQVVVAPEKFGVLCLASPIYGARDRNVR